MATGQQGPPTRPWFRLATMVRPPPSAAPAPQPAQAPPSRPTIITRPELALRLSQPPVVARATPTPITSSPPKTEQIIPSNPNTTTTTTISNPPSPLALPSPQLKYSNQATKVDNNDNSRRSLDKRTKTAINKLHPEDVVGNGMTRRVIIAGENKGAIMDVSSDKSAASDTNNYYSKKSNISRNNNYIKPLMGAVMNSNVQGVNNSILYNSSTTHHDPGLHLSLSRKNASSSSGRGN